jgi:hypothetical protein
MGRRVGWECIKAGHAACNSRTSVMLFGVNPIYQV